MDTKSLRVEVKDADKGEISAVFATFNTIDHDGDVTVPGAFTDGAPVTISAYGHKTWDGLLPVGRGVIRTDGEKAWMEGKFFLNTTSGRDHFEVLKELKDLQEFSYGYDAVEYSFGEHEGKQVRFLKKQLVHEVSQVLKGAGIDTRVLSVKSNTKFADQAQAVVAAVRALSDRAADVLAKRQEKGKGLGADSAALLAEVEQELKRFGDLLATAPDEPDTGELQRIYLQHLARTHR